MSARSAIDFQEIARPEILDAGRVKGKSCGLLGVSFTTPARRWASDGEELIARQEEVPGVLFDPFIATTVTGLSRLWLGCLESLIRQHNLDYAYMHTDGGFILKGQKIIPEVDENGEAFAVKAVRPMTPNEFIAALEAVQAWFKPLYPYADKDDPKAQFLKLEPENFDPDTGKWRELHCFALGVNMELELKLPRFRRVVLDLGDYDSVVTASIAAS